MSGQHEGLVGNILDKVKDLLTDDDEDRKDPKREQDPPLTPQCCGMPPGQTLVAWEHKADCPNHPDNVAKEEVAS